MDQSTVLTVESLSKKFCKTLRRSLFYGTIDIMRSMLGINYDTSTLRKAEFWALDNISFDLKKGETLGIIGVNGSGKSTLLRLITGIFPPDKGLITYRGRIGALIAVGAGFHPHMTGKENIYLNGTILGMRKKEIDRKLEDIVEFADIGDFLEAPVSTYSNGMTVRLGFSIAVHCEPDILLVDEVLAVGDLAFRNKTMRKMTELREKGNSLIFISHNLEQIRLLCDRVIILDQGEIIYNGDTDAGIIAYENRSKDLRVKTINKSLQKNNLFRMRSVEENRIVLKDLSILNMKGQKVNELGVYDELKICLEFSINEGCEEIFFVVSILNEEKDTDCLWVKSNDMDKYLFKDIEPGYYRASVAFKNHHLAPGVYFLNYAIRNAITSETLDHGFTNLSFAVKSDHHFERGIVLAEDQWELVRIES